MAPNLTFGSPPGADDILQGAQDLAQQQINQRQLNIEQQKANTQSFQARTQHGQAQAQANSQAYEDALSNQQEGYAEALNTQRLMNAMQNSAIGQVGAQAIGMDDAYVPQGAFDDNSGDSGGGD